MAKKIVTFLLAVTVPVEGVDGEREAVYRASERASALSVVLTREGFEHKMERIRVERPKRIR